MFDHVSWLAPMIWGASILALYVGYRVLFPFSLGSWVIGFALWMASWHLGLTMISIIPERGSPDLIHSLKTGWMIPFCVLAVGLPVLSVRVHGNG